MRRLAPLLLAILLLVSGCAGKGKANAAPQETDPNSLPPGVVNVLEGTVTGSDLTPLGSVNVTINGLGTSNITNEAGYYRFENVPPRDYIITATKEGYRQKPQRAVIQEDAIFQLDFILEEVPTETPYSVLDQKTLFIGCMFSYQSSPDSPQAQNCGENLPNNVQEGKFTIQRLGAQVQAEFDWLPQGPTGTRITATLESKGDDAVQFAHDKGDPGMKAVVSQSLMRKYYPEGGDMFAGVASAVHVFGDESAADIGAAFQQEIEVYFTVFYVEPGPPSYTAIPE